MPLLVLALTDSPAQAGLVAAARSAPYLVLGLPAGALIDRLDRRIILICCDVARALAMGSVPLAWLFDTLTVAQLFVVAAIQGTALVFANLAQTASLPRLVRRDQIASAQALSASSQGIASLIGPGLGGFIISLGRNTVAGAVLGYLVDAASYVVSLVMLATIRTPLQMVRPRSERKLTGQIGEGLRYVWRDNAIRLLAMVNAGQRLCMGPVAVLAVIVLGRDDLGLDPAGIGLLVSAAGGGGLIGSALTPPLRRRLPVGWHMIGVVAGHAMGLAVVAASGSVPVIMAGLALVGAMESMSGIVQVSYRLAVIPDELQGRVNSVYRMGSFAAMALGTSLVGFLVEGGGPRLALWILAGWVAVIAVGSALSDVRRLRTERT